MAAGSKTDMQALRRNFNLTDAVCSINEFPHKQVFVPNDASTSEESDGWCHITHVQSSKSILNNNDEDDTLLNSKGCQTDDIHLYISDMLISSVEQMQWNELKRNIDFSHPVDPRVFFAEADQCSSMQESNHSCAPTASTSTSASQKREGNSVFYTSNSNDSVASSSNCTSNISDEPKAALTPESPLMKNQSNNAEPVVSALVEYLKNKQRRSVASNSTSCIEGLASYAATPQKLIPIPNEIPITLDESYDIEGKRVRLKGTAVWAPLKKKFIFDVPSVSHKE
ncbi:run domain Beclin-1-interacting and cysteine-rich domain-containing protein [Ditylenchus destructor]|nr:run domain Beclin-1-interacting and cysteine-rich domain-containing protein [Ditylenchus destructor]